MKFVQMKDGTEYDVLYALRKKGKVKYDFVTEDEEKLKAYLAAAHDQKKEEIVIHDRECSDG